MYKPQTVEQYKILQYLKQTFELQHFILAPVSRSSLMLEDTDGERIAFTLRDGTVSEIPVPEPISREKVHEYIMSLKKSPHAPLLHNYQEITHWWLNTPNPLTHQQALGLSNELYRHYLTHDLLDDDAVIALASQKAITEQQYNDILVWYLNGNFASCWLGPYGVDGTGNSYRLVINYRRPEEKQFIFYVQDEYYCFMNGLSYPIQSGK